MRLSLTLTLTLLLVPPAAAGDPPGDAFAPKGGRYSARFPGKPKEATQTAKTPAGDQKVHTATYATADGSIFLVSYHDLSADAGKPEFRAPLYNGGRDGWAGKDGKVVSEKEVTIGGEKGREVVIDKGKVQTRVRLVVKDGRFFQVAALGTGEFVTGAEATAFLDSFAFAK